MKEELTREDFRSDEELQFYYWLLEAVEAGLVHSWAYEPRAFQIHDGHMIERKEYLKTKTNKSTVSLFDNREVLMYTPDFVFGVSELGSMLWKGSAFWRPIQSQSGTVMNNIVVVDIKGSYNPHGGSHAEFFLKQRMMWDKHNIYVQKVNPKVFFQRTWAPERLRWCKGRKIPTLNKMGMKSKNIEAYIKDNGWAVEKVRLSSEELFN